MSFDFLIGIPPKTCKSFNRGQKAFIMLLEFILSRYVVLLLTTVMLTLVQAWQSFFKRLLLFCLNKHKSAKGAFKNYVGKMRLVFLEMSTVIRFSLENVKEFLHQCQPGVVRWSKAFKIVSR